MSAPARRATDEPLPPELRPPSGRRRRPEPLRPRSRDVDWAYVAEQCGCSRTVAYERLRACALAMGRDPEAKGLLRVPEAVWLAYHRSHVLRVKAPPKPEKAAAPKPEKKANARRESPALPPISQPRHRPEPQPLPPVSQPRHPRKPAELN